MVTGDNVLDSGWWGAPSHQLGNPDGWALPAALLTVEDDLTMVTVDQVGFSPENSSGPSLEVGRQGNSTNLILFPEREDGNYSQRPAPIVF